LTDDVDNGVAVKSEGAREALDDGTEEAGETSDAGIARLTNGLATLDGARKAASILPKVITENNPLLTRCCIDRQGWQGEQLGRTGEQPEAWAWKGLRQRGQRR
jgi:hypothetical protein